MQISPEWQLVLDNYFKIKEDWQRELFLKNMNPSQRSYLVSLANSQMAVFQPAAEVHTNSSFNQPTSNYTTNPNSTQSYGVGQPNFTTNPYATQAHSTGQSYSTTNPDPAQAYGVGQPNIMTNPETSQAYGSGQPNTGVWQVPSDPHRQYPSGAGPS